MESHKLEKYLLLLLSLLVGGVLFALAIISPGLEGGMDSYNHYLISRWSVVYPERLLLDQWGKPIYNILSAPFAQFGLIGVEVFNILLLIASAWMGYLIARTLKLANAWMAFVMILFSPIFIGKTISGLTEPLSAFLLLLTIYWLLKDQYVAGAILAGFLPYARSEGYVIMAVIGLYLLYRRQWLPFLLLGIGSMAMNTVGWIVEGDYLWLYNSNPYIKVQAEKGSSCGHGTLLHYIHTAPFTFGRLTTVLFALGSILVLVNFWRKRTQEHAQKIFFLVLGVFALYFLIHAWIWYAGLMGSCGYERVMIVIAPLMAIVSLIGLNAIIDWVGEGYGIGTYLKEKFSNYKDAIRIFALSVVTLLMIYEPVKWYGKRYPLPISQEQELFKEAAEWFNTTDYNERKVYHLYPYFSILTDMNPYDEEQHVDLWSFDFRYAPKGSIIIWDTHFGPNESSLPLKQLQQHEDFTEIKSFIPEKPFPTLNSDHFEIHIFERTGTKMLDK